MLKEYPRHSVDNTSLHLVCIEPDEYVALAVTTLGLYLNNITHKRK